MRPDAVTQIKIGRNKIGIIGLKHVFKELSTEYESMTDEDIKMHLMERLGKNNYISNNVRQDYEDAFFREFKKFMGVPVDTDTAEATVDIKILGQGCIQCNQLEQDMFSIISEMKIDADIEHVTDIVEIGKYGVMGTPALVINGIVKAVGSVPPKSKIMNWLTMALPDKQ